MHAERRARLRRRLADAGLDALLVTRLPNVRYLTGFDGSAGRLLVSADGAHLVTDGRYDEQAGAQAPDVPRTITRDDGWLRAHVPAGSRLGLESHALPWDVARRIASLLDDVDVVPAPDHVEALRATKDDDEMAQIARAAAIADAAFAQLCGWLAPTMTERAVARRLDESMRDGGADDAAFATIVAGGPNAALPHHRSGERRLQPGDVVLLDFGALVAGYHSDMSRMVALGAPAPELRRAFAAVRAAQEAGLAALAPGVEAKAVDAACRDALGELRDRFVHPTGHGVGLEIHEPPILSAQATAIITERMVVTVEPGAYLPGLGGVRVEDTVALTTEGPRILTTTPKDLVVL